MSQKPLKNDLLLRALRRQPTARTPIWIMRQAGRYLPEYRRLRASAETFQQMYKVPERACEASLQPIARYELDAVILFSDILTIPEAMGLELHFVEGQGPVFSNPLTCAADVRRLGVPDPESELSYVPKAVRMIHAELDGRLPLIGFAGSPWTMAAYMVQGKGSKDFMRARSLLHQEPKWMHHLLGLLAEAACRYLNAQIAAGAQALMIFDTWGGLLNEQCYQECSLSYMQRIVEGLQLESFGQRIPVIFFSKGAGPWVERIARSGCDAIGLDWTSSLGEVRRRVGDRIALQGNLDPSILFAAPERIRAEAGKLLQDYGNGPGHVFNLGHGIHPETDPERVQVLIEAVHGLSWSNRSLAS